MKVKDIRELSVQEIEKSIADGRLELLNMNLRRKQADQLNKLRNCKVNIARMLTILQEKKLLASKAK